MGPLVLTILLLASAGTILASFSRPASAASATVFSSERILLGLATSPSAIAVDRAGDVFIADGIHDRIVELPTGSRDEVILPFTDLQQPSAVAVDSKGDVFATDLTSKSVLELPAGRSASRQLPLSGLQNPSGIAVDAKGDVFVADSQADDVVELPAGATRSHVMTQFSGLVSPSAVAVDGRGDLYVAADLGIYELATGASTAVDDGLDMSVTSLAVDSLGDRYFTTSGERQIAYELPAGATTDPTPLPLGTLGEARGIGLDAAGDLYLGIPDQDELAKIAKGASSYTTLPLQGLGLGTGIAVNGAGEIYVADLEQNDVVELSATGQQSVAASLAARSEPEGLALDAAGDLYIAQYLDGFSELTAGGELLNTSFGGTSGTTSIAVSDTGSLYYVIGSSVMRYVPGQSGYVGDGVPVGPVDLPQGLAIDTAGDLFVSDSGDNRVLELSSGGSSPITLPFSGLSDPRGIAVDPAGDVFVVDTGNNRVVELPAGSSQQVVLPFTNLDRPIDVAVDGPGDVVVDDNRSGLVELVAQSGSSPGTTIASKSTTVPPAGRSAPALLSSVAIRPEVIGRRVRVELRCAKLQRCAGSVTLTHGRTLLAAGRYRLGTAEGTVLELTLDRAARLLLARAVHHRLAATLEVAVTGGQTVRRIVVLARR